MKIIDDYFIVTFLNVVLDAAKYKERENSKLLDSDDPKLLIHRMVFPADIRNYEEIKSRENIQAMLEVADKEEFLEDIKDRRGLVNYQMVTKKGLSFVMDHLQKMMVLNTDEEKITQALSGEKEIVDYILDRHRTACEMLFEARRKGKI